jgi:hypothetical protein
MLKEFTKHLENARTVCHLTVHDSPASNGAAEQANCTHIDGAQAMMEAVGLSKHLWAEAVHHHVWIQNRVPMCALPEMRTPYKIGTGEKLDLSAVCPWGCKAWVKRLGVGKLKPKAKEYHFVGIDNESKGYRIYWPEKNCVSVERNVYFNESEVLEPEDAPIEGEHNIWLPTNLGNHQPSNAFRIISEPLQTVENVLNMLNETHKLKNIENVPKICPKASETQSEPISALHQKPTR